MVNKEIVQRKLKKLNLYLEQLEHFANITFEEYLESFPHQRAVERLIQLIVDVAIDINSHVLVDEGHPPPDDAFDSFIQVARIGILPEEFAQEIAPSTGERNIIVHEYEKIDHQLVYDSIKDALKIYRKFIDYYLEYIK